MITAIGTSARKEPSQTSVCTRDSLSVVYSEYFPAAQAPGVKLQPVVGFFQVQIRLFAAPLEHQYASHRPPTNANKSRHRKA